MEWGHARGVPTGFGLTRRRGPHPWLPQVREGKTTSRNHVEEKRTSSSTVQKINKNPSTRSFNRSPCDQKQFIIPLSTTSRRNMAWWERGMSTSFIYIIKTHHFRFVSLFVFFPRYVVNCGFVPVSIYFFLLFLYLYLSFFCVIKPISRHPPIRHPCRPRRRLAPRRGCRAPPCLGGSCAAGVR